VHLCVYVVRTRDACGIARAALKLGVDVNRRDAKGDRPVFTALRARKLAVVRLLLGWKSVGYVDVCARAGECAYA
jgi:hypothetical protein